MPPASPDPLLNFFVVLSEPAAVTRGRGIHFKGSRDDD